MLGLKGMIMSKGGSRTIASEKEWWWGSRSSGRNKKWPGSAVILKVAPKDFIIIGCRLGESKK